MPLELERLSAALSDRYRIERELGAGGMATVFLAEDLKHDRRVALKVLRPELARAAGADRFLREIRITARLTHPHILPLLDSGEADGLLYYVAPYIEGESLRDRLTRDKELSLRDACRIATDVAEALACAHEAGVVHRDIKPENILLSRGGAVVADFGIARALSMSDPLRLTETGFALGTPGYMSPEQALGGAAVDGRTDIYALGCVLYEMLAGQPPYTASNAQALLARRLSATAPRIRTVRRAVPEWLDRVVLRSLSRDPADRYATASEFAEALAPAGVGSARRQGTSPWVWVAGAIVVLAVVGWAASRLGARRDRTSVVPSASRMLVLPFVPSGPDTALARLGRDLVFTVSAELDGLGDIRVVDAHTVLAQATAAERYSPADGVALARRFGAGSLVQGSLVREGQRVRADFSLLPADGADRPLARGSVIGPLDSVAALTDSTVHALLAQVWVRGTAPTPSLEGALRTGSANALRAFLQGEQQLAGGRWADAAASYAQARQADSTFWLAAAREAFALNWTLHEPSDTLLDVLRTHRDELPAAERLSTDAIVHISQLSVGPALERTRELTERNPSSWFGWLIHADQLLHNGPLLGHRLDEARAGFERALELNPNLIPAHEHLMLVTLYARDTLRAAKAYGELVRLDAGPVLTADGYGTRLLQYRYLLAIERGDSALVAQLVDSIARDPAPSGRYSGTFFDPYLYGYPRHQIRVSQRAMEIDGAAGRDWLRELLPLSWAGRGAWDSALTIMDRLAAHGSDSSAALKAYGMSVVGAWLGALDAGEADRHRAAAAGSLHGESARVELAWLDGILAVARRDRRALSAARTALGEPADAGTKALERSLAAFDQGLAGNAAAAGTAMAELEWQEAQADAPDFMQHPFTIAVDRIAAARWLAETGDAEQAARMLNWIEGPYLLHTSVEYSTMVSGLVARERGLIEERLGHAAAAREFYREFLRLYDQPMPGHRGLVQDAEARVARLAQLSGSASTPGTTSP